MRDGVVRCPWCKRPVKLLKSNGLMHSHYASLGKVGAGFRGLSQKCEGSYRKPEGVA